MKRCAAVAAMTAVLLASCSNANAEMVIDRNELFAIYHANGTAYRDVFYAEYALINKCLTELGVSGDYLWPVPEFEDSDIDARSIVGDLRPDPDDVAEEGYQGFYPSHELDITPFDWHGAPSSGPFGSGLSVEDEARQWSYMLGDDTNNFLKYYDDGAISSEVLKLLDIDVDQSRGWLETHPQGCLEATRSLLYANGLLEKWNGANHGGNRIHPDSHPLHRDIVEDWQDCVETLWGQRPDSLDHYRGMVYAQRMGGSDLTSDQFDQRLYDLAQADAACAVELHVNDRLYELQEELIRSEIADDPSAFWGFQELCTEIVTRAQRLVADDSVTFVR